MTVKRENLIQIEDKLYQKCKVHLLTTNNNSSLRLYCNKGGLAICPIIYSKEQWKPVHIYITSDEKIKEGDWILNFAFKEQDPLLQKCMNNSEAWRWNNEPMFKYRSFKIIATTDTSLKVSNDYNPEWLVPISQPSQEFINRYIEEYNKRNKIEDVLVEYELNIPENANKFPHFKVEVVRCVWEEDYRLKINPKDNTITIRKVKDSWSREEVISLIKKYSKEACGQPWFDTDDKWIEENL